MSSPLILPDSRQRTIATPKDAVNLGAAGFYVPIFCGSCGAPGGQVPQENMTFVSWFCNSCFEKYGDQTLLYVMPDEVFWAEVANAQQEKYGRSLTAEETVLSLADPDSLESRLARSRAALTPKAGE